MSAHCLPAIHVLYVTYCWEGVGGEGTRLRLCISNFLTSSRRSLTLHVVENCYSTIKVNYEVTVPFCLLGGEEDLEGETIGSRDLGHTVEDQGTTTTGPAATMIGGDIELTHQIARLPGD